MTTANRTPTADEWRNAFLDVEDRILHIDNMAKVLRHLAGQLHDDATDNAANMRTGFAYLAEVTAQAAFNMLDAAKAADRAYYEAFNELVGRENDTLLKGGV